MPVLTCLFVIALLNILAGAHEFKENLSVQANEQEALKAVDNVIVDELEHRFGERFERAVRDIAADYDTMAHHVI